MNCDEFEKYVLNYLTDRDFDPELKHKMEEHYFECDNCFNSLELATATIGVIHSEGVDNLLQYSGGKEIQEKLSELLDEQEDTYPIPNDLELLVKKLSMVKSMNRSPGDLTLSQDPLLGARMFGAERGVEESIYMLGEGISIDLEPPKDGYLTILLYDDANNLKLLFPENATDDTFVKGGEKKQFEIVAAEPLGKQYFKAFWTSDQLMVPDKIDFGDESAICSAIKTFLNSISALDDDEWMVFEKEFEVVKE